jgi:hypothetical protein
MRAGLIASGAVVLGPNAPPGRTASTTEQFIPDGRRHHQTGATAAEGERP